MNILLAVTFTGMIAVVYVSPYTVKYLRHLILAFLLEIIAIK